MNLDLLRAWPFDEVRHTYDERDVMLYALGVGLGSDQLSAAQLRFVYEKDLVVLPSFVTAMAVPPPWLGDQRLGLARARIVHGGIGFDLHAPLPRSASVASRNRITGVFDAGAAVGAIIGQERDVTDTATGRRLATVRSHALARGDGGFGGPPPEPAPAPPEGPPHVTTEIATLPQQALLYRLSGDRNPLHVDPDYAAKAGYPRPILHGLATFGIAVQALLRTVCEHDATRLRSMDAQFSAPVFPGDTIRCDFWKDGDTVRFTAHVAARGKTVLRAGRALLGRGPRAEEAAS